MGAFFIRFDIGEIIDQRKCEINPNESAPELTNKLALLGAELLVDVVKKLPICLDNAKSQPTQGISYGTNYYHFFHSLNNLLHDYFYLINISLFQPLKSHLLFQKYFGVKCLQTEYIIFTEL